MRRQYLVWDRTFGRWCHNPLTHGPEMWTNRRKCLAEYRRIAARTGREFDIVPLAPDRAQSVGTRSGARNAC